MPRGGIEGRVRAHLSVAVFYVKSRRNRAVMFSMRSADEQEHRKHKVSRYSARAIARDRSAQEAAGGRGAEIGGLAGASQK